MLSLNEQRRSRSRLEAVRHYLFDDGNTEAGFLRLIGWFRFLVLLSLTFRFGFIPIDSQTLDNPTTPLLAVRITLGIYFVFIIFLRFLADFKANKFESNRSKFAQIIVDIVVITICYTATGYPRSDVFLMYFLPFLIVARYFETKVVIIFFALVGVAASLPWVILKDLANLPLAQTLGQVLSFRLGFLSIVGVFYLAYQRRRRVIGQLGKVEDELWQRYQELSVGLYHVDGQLKIKSMNNVMRQRHGLGLMNRPCASALCHTAVGRGPCSQCPVATAIEQGREVSDTIVDFVDREEAIYQARVSALPVFNGEREVTGATAIVHDLGPRKQFENRLRSYAVDIERTIDTFITDNRKRTKEMTRQLEMLSRASAAVLAPNKPLRVDSIVKTMADLLRCQRANVRQYDFVDEQEECGLVLHHSYGHLPEESSEWSFLSLKKPGIVTKAFQEGKPIQVIDVQSHPDYVQYLDLAHRFRVHAMACFPLIAEGNRLGTVSLYRNRRESFSPEEMNLGEALANNLAAAICNQQLVENIAAEMALRQKGLDTLSRISRQLVPHDNIYSLTQVLADLICEELGAEVSAVFLLEGDHLYRHAIAGVESDWFTEEKYAVGQGITGQVVANGRCICENAVDLCQDAIPEHLTLYSKHLSSGAVKHLLAVPLHGQYGISGVLRVVNKLNGNRQLQATGFTQQDKALIQTIACIAAVAMENARRLAEQRFLMDVGWAVTSNISSAEILVESLNRAVDILDAEAGAVILPEKETGDMIFQFIGGKGAAGLYGRKIPANKGITGQVFRSGKPTLLPDVTKHPEFYRSVDVQASFSTRSLLSVPIKAGLRIIGVLEILNKRHGTFTKADQQLLTALSAWVAIALENARLFTAESEKRKLANVLRESTQVFSSTLNLEAILSTMLGQLLRVVHYHRACVFLCERNMLILHSEINSENPDSVCMHTTVPIVQSAVFREIESSKQPHLLNDIPLEFDHDPIMSEGKELRAWLGIPLVYRNDVLGLLTIDSRKPLYFTEEDIQIVATFARQAAIAISNARLFKEEKERANELLVLNKSQVEITTMPSLEETADKIADCVIELLQCDFSGVALYNHDTKEIYALPHNGYRGVSPEYAQQFRFDINQSGAYVLRNRRIYTSSHVQSDVDSDFGLKFVKPIGIEAFLAAPLLAGEREIGILYAASQTPRVFTEDEQTIFSILANQAAVALRNAELLFETRRRAELLELFHQISIAGQQTTERDRIINIVLTGITAGYGLRFNRVLLLLVDSTGKYLEGYTGIGQTDKNEAEAAWATIEEGDTIDGHVADILHNGVRAWTPMHTLAQNLNIPIETDSPELFSQVFLTQKGLIVDPSEGKWLINQEFYRAFKPSIFALVPLVKDRHVIGLLVADKKFILDAISQADLDLLSACANQAAAAIERAGLYKIVQSRIRELKHLQETTQDIAHLSDLRQVLHHIVKAANDVLMADISYLVPYDAQKDKLLANLATYYGTQGDFKHHTTYSRQGLTKLIMDEPSRLITIEDLSAMPKLMSRFVQQENVCSVALARLEFHGQTVGLLYVNYCQYHCFSDQEKRVLQMFADQAAIAIHNANLIKEYEATAMQKERDRLREDIHDALNTFQFQVMLPLEELRDEVKAQGDKIIAAELARVWQFSRHTNQIFHQIMNDLRESILLEKGLTAALNTFISGERETSNLDIDLQIVGRIRPTADIEHALYRICQEAVRNVTKHAHSNQVIIKLILLLDMIHLTIDDDGIGFQPEAIVDRSQGMGLDSMRNWAAKVGSNLVLKSKPGKGTHIEVLILPD